MNNIIIHISDLHISDQTGVFGKANKNTYLTVGIGNHNQSYISHFTDKIKEISCNKKFLVLTGDITNIGEIIEFDEAVQNVKQLMEELNISKDDILLIPGDHDIHRDSIKEELRIDKNANEERILQVKQKNFSDFYNKIKERDFEYHKLIFDKIEIDNIVLLAINSNSNVNQNGGHGFLQVGKFEDELKLYREQYPKNELILCLHHNFEGEHEDSHFGQWQKENKKDLVAVFERHNIKCILNGNEHTPNSNKLAGRDIIVSDSGFFSSNSGVEASFKVYEIVEEGSNLLLKNSVYGLRKLNANRETNFGNWVNYKISEIRSIEEENFILRKETIVVSKETFELPASPQEDISTIENVITPEIVVYENGDIQAKLYNIIKEKKLFHQGHFHWSETSRAHNWIDTARLLEDKEDLTFVKNAIIDVLEQSKIIADVDLIIGLGYEGNIISSKASIKYDVPYTFLPYSYRWKDHNKFENKLNFENGDKKFKTVLLITDVVNDGRTIRKLVGKGSREKKFFDNVDKIIVVSLFYTGDQQVNNNILNFDNLPTKQKEGDENVNNIEFYTIKHLKVEKCPYGENYKNECFILKDNLHCVHKFYTEE